MEPPAETAAPAAAPAVAAQQDIRFHGPDRVQEVVAILLEQGAITEDQLTEAQNRASLTGQPLDTLLLDESIIDEHRLLQAYSTVSGIPFHKIGDFKIDPAIVERVNSRLALRHRVVPVQFQEGILTLAVARVPPSAMVEGLHMVLETPLAFILCTESDVARSLTHFYGLGAETVEELIANAPVDEDEGRDDDISVISDETGMVRFINMIIAEGIRMDATDIHIEPFEDTLRLRCRVDGILQEVPLPKGVEKLKRSVSSAVKIMAAMDIAERRRPHDGRIKVRYDKGEYDLRVSVLPTGYGETCCLRILNRSSVFTDLDRLGLSPNQLPKIRAMTDLPHGVILLTGPTGSGKTTTLYAILARLNTTGVKIITVEDPVEYQMDGISQVQVYSKIDLTFANVLRSVLRHDPDVILIGEIRDSETADIAVRSSLTGHLVLSTLHTNDAPSAITRLTDMGVEPYLIASCVEGIVAQRLVRRVCTQCSHPDDLAPEIRGEILACYPDFAGKERFVIGNGCPNCAFTGYRGRSAINEVMVMSDPLRSLVVRRDPANIIKDLAIDEGMITLRRDGYLRIVEGRTSLEEVLRVVGKGE